MGSAHHARDGGVPRAMGAATRLRDNWQPWEHSASTGDAVVSYAQVAPHSSFRNRLFGVECCNRGHRFLCSRSDSSCGCTVRSGQHQGIGARPCWSGHMGPVLSRFKAGQSHIRPMRPNRSFERAAVGKPRSAAQLDGSIAFSNPTPSSGRLAAPLKSTAKAHHERHAAGTPGLFRVGWYQAIAVQNKTAMHAYCLPSPMR